MRRNWPRSLSAVGDFIPGKAIKYREDAERAMREFEHSGLDGVLVVMLTYGPAMRVARLLTRVAAAGVPGQHPAGTRGDARLGYGGHDLQPGRARRPGHRKRDGEGRLPVQRADR